MQKNLKETQREVKAYVRPELHKRLMVLSAQRELPVSDVIRVVCLAWLNGDARLNALLRDYVASDASPEK